ncbi:hypothetical protein PASE110613_13270 [Paenibacillus sediminis]|uniref:Uncharacterized protein n=1 Tax=Paenibacillus sediminis TaxID=664909 RepID=A0ABS4H3P6_9BACL|nr:hypothetical protein [Paenibacillus sediminis]
MIKDQQECIPDGLIFTYFIRETLKTVCRIDHVHE